MDRSTFARSFVLETLPDEMLYRVRLNQSCDGNPLHMDERVYPEDTARNLTENFSRCAETEVTVPSFPQLPVTPKTSPPTCCPNPPTSLTASTSRNSSRASSFRSPGPRFASP